MSSDATDPNADRERMRNPTRNVAVVGLLNDANRILLVRTSRLPNHWQPLGGGMEQGDSSPEDALIREVREETGVELAYRDLKFELATNYDFGSGTVYFFSLRLPSGVKLSFDAGEVLEWRWFTLDQALNLQVFPATRQFIDHLLRVLNRS